jgi:cytochrome c biogenesis protein CcdA
MKRPGALAAAVVLAVLAASPCRAAGATGVSFTPDSWHFGMILQGEKIEVTLTVTNGSARPVSVTLTATCDCLTSAPSSRTIAPGEEGMFALAYDSSDDTGNVRKNFLVTTDAPGLERAYFELRGTVRAERASAAEEPDGAGDAQAGGPRIAMVYYYTPGCRSCEKFLAQELPRMERELAIRIVVERKDILDPAVYEELASLASSLGQSVRAMPVLLAGRTLLQGEKEIEARIDGVLTSLATGLDGDGATGPTESPLLPHGLSVLAVVAAGLLDGVNPCAFTTLIFLLASLALAGRGRREVLVIGAFFSLSVFLTYLAIGLGFFAALRAAAVVPLVSRVLRWLLVAVLVAFAGMSVYDYVLIRGGKPTKILLQLPSVLKRQIHKSIRTQVRAAALVGGSLLLGFLVSIFEFACTGQVYLPTLAYLVRVRRQASAIGLLVLYNVCFILPLLAVFAASWLGVSSGKITALFQKHMGAVKLGLAAVFLGLAGFTLWGG